MKPRKPLILESTTKYAANIYTYADSINRALQKTRVPKVKGSSAKPLFKGITTMQNQTGRDNKMYYVSDGFNLDESLENQFTSLLTLNGVRES